MSSIQLTKKHVPSGRVMCCCCPLQHEVIDESRPVTLDQIMSENEYREQVQDINKMLVSAQSPFTDAMSWMGCLMCCVFIFAFVTIGIGMLCCLPIIIFFTCTVTQRQHRSYLIIEQYFQQMKDSGKWTSKGIEWRVRRDRVVHRDSDGHARSTMVLNYFVDISARTLTKAGQSSADDDGWGSKATPGSESKFCTKCGTPLSMDAVFCSKCGNKQ
eukprot:TRINITY_DN9243_c0_g1_i1.p1 TRINITY_DN9243_c0_g1~~TRINITY_DN9243_c0_g1_i1.p1  ORF type:complete len:215 (-),score=50.19 TRINITY_DN9243_c0_g1_i1:429-1073(-)